jgi:hypothetical protein
MAQIDPEGQIISEISIHSNQIYTQIPAFMRENSKIFREVTGQEELEPEVNYSQIYHQIQKYIQENIE